MQIRKDQLVRQQMIMSILGFYRHKCDGIWGPASIAAKRKWELNKIFIPGLPNNGLPLGEDGPLPKGMRFNSRTKLFDHVDLTDDKIKSLSLQKKAETESQPIVKTEAAPIPVVKNAPVNAQTNAPTEVKEALVEAPKVEANKTSAEVPQTLQNAQNNQNTQRGPNQNQNRHKRRR